MTQLSYSPPPYVPAPTPKRGMPAWGWAALGGCGCVGFFFVAIFAAILFPVFSQAREKARQSACLSNLRRMGLAAVMYQSDYDGASPPASQWMDKLTLYTNGGGKKEDLYTCPVVRSRQSGTYGYAYNRSIADKPVSKILNPETKLMIYDSSTQARNASDAGTSLPSPGRHSGGNNIAYVDGHAKWIRSVVTP